MGEPTTATPSPAVARLGPLLTRRSASVLLEPGPDPAELEAILQAAATVPDHGGVRPWRLVVVSGPSRELLADALAATFAEHRPDIDPERVRRKAFAAPTAIAVASHVDTSRRLPVWEQVATATCTGFAMVLAAHQLGLGAVWKSLPFNQSRALAAFMDMGPDDQFLGWVNLGRLADDHDRSPRAPVDLRQLVRVP